MPETTDRRRAHKIKLHSLAPAYDENQHGIYVTALVDALSEMNDVRNIALTGAYGTGKSSILAHLTELVDFKDRVLVLSLSTVGLSDQQPDPGTDQNPAAWTKTNLIQKEIVKQILYRDTPAKTRGSRFRRISRFNRAPEIGIALGTGILLFAILWLTGLATPLIRVFGEKPPFWSVMLGYGALFVVLAGVVYALRWLTHNRIFLEKLSAGPATVSLNSSSSTYFDQYMDEIVYYFEQSGRDVVVFEDIDRFDDPNIFEALRALNTLLNGSEQVRRRRQVGRAKPPEQKPAQPEQNARQPEQKRESRGASVPDVKFIYALRDSVFEKLGDKTGDDAADDEVKRANRTKFFDIVIPVVPFITHRNARDLMLDAMEGTGVSRGLVNVAARFVADMRLIHDMRNEYDIYADRLLGTPNQMPGLDPDHLFALIIYKCVHMKDFESIRLGTSDLDALHDVWRDIVTHSLADAYKRGRDAENRLASAEISEKRARELGGRLERVAHAITPDENYVSDTYVSIAGEQFKGNQLREVQFWTRLTQPGSSIIIGNSRAGTSFPLTIDRLGAILERPLSSDDWKQMNLSTARQDYQSALNDIGFLRHHDWSEIYGRPEFTTKGKTASGESFADATERTLTSRLARALVAGGFINDYFALYVSVYYGKHLRPRAINYIVHTLDRGLSDIQYVLDEEDIEAIIDDKGTDIFRDRAAYNINILDHLLSKRPREAEIIVQQMSAWNREDRDFASAYMHVGTEQVKLIRLLAPLLPERIATIVTEAPEAVLAQVIDAALDYAGVEIRDDTDSEFSGLVVENYKEFPSISTTALSKIKLPPRRHNTVGAIAQLGIRLPSTVPLTGAARADAIDFNTYELNAENIVDLTGQPLLALDAICASNAKVFGAALDQVEEYLALVADTPDAFTVDASDELAAILGLANQFGVTEKQLDQIVEMASPKCQVDDLTDAPQSVWPTLAATKRTAPSAANLLAYFQALGRLDDSIGSFLAEVTTIDEPSSLSEGDRVRLAVAILSAKHAFPSARHRVSLAASLDLPTPISATLLKPESGELVGLMVEEHLLADDETTFASTLACDWSTLENALVKSKNAPTFLSPASLPAKYVEAFFRSTRVPDILKKAVIARLSDFLAGADEGAMRSMAFFAASSRADLSFDSIDRLRAGGASSGAVISLLSSSTTASVDEIRAELRSLGKPYQSIADRGNGRPLVPDDHAHRKLLNRLREADIVNGYKPEHGQLRVSLRKP